MIPTHTTRHLEATLRALGASEKPAASVVISVDGEDDGFSDLLARAPLRRETQRALVTRPHQGEPRLNQVRNNGLRALRQFGWCDVDDLVLVIDGDMAIGAKSIGQHVEAVRAGGEVVLASRVNVSEAETEALVEQLVSGDTQETQTLMDRYWAQGHEALVNRQRRLLRQVRQRAWPVVGRVVVKSHKPKLLGGHHAVRWKCFESINGYDERFVGYGYDDDDLARRLYASGARVAVRVDSIQAFHLWHPTRAPKRATDAPGYRVFQDAWQVRAVSGMNGGAPQPGPMIRWIDAICSDADEQSAKHGMEG